MRHGVILLASAALSAGLAGPALASDAEREQAAENFLEADANADQQLDSGEFRTLIDLNAEDGIGRASVVRRLGRYNTAFARVDANNDGVVTPEELSAAAGEGGN